jgi:hypothetical protein
VKRGSPNYRVLSGDKTRLLFAFLILPQTKALHKAVNLPGGVHDTLLTGIKRVAVGAKLYL